MISLFAYVKVFSLWPKTMDYIIVRGFAEIEVVFCGPFTTGWKVL